MKKIKKSVGLILLTLLLSTFACVPLASQLNREAFDFAESKGAFNEHSFKIASKVPGTTIQADSLFSVALTSEPDSTLTVKVQVRRSYLERLVEIYIHKGIEAFQKRLKNKKSIGLITNTHRLISIRLSRCSKLISTSPRISIAQTHS